MDPKAYRHSLSGSIMFYCRRCSGETRLSQGQVMVFKIQKFVPGCFNQWFFGGQSISEGTSKKRQNCQAAALPA